MAVMARKDEPRAPGQEKPTGEKGKDKSSRGTAAIQIDAQLAQWVRTIASHDGISQGDVVREILTPYLRTVMERVKREIGEGLKKPMSD